MMFNPVLSILGQATREKNKPYNILTCVTHSPYECELAKSNVILYGYQDGDILPWNYCREVPSNYILLERGKGDDSIPKGVDFTACLSQNPEAHYKYMRKYSQLMGIPLINLHHTLPHSSADPQYPATMRHFCKSYMDVFISKYSKDIWGYDKAEVIHHSANVVDFRPIRNIPKKPYILTVANLYRSRDWALGYRLYENITKGLPKQHVGNDEDPRFSQPIQDPLQLNFKLNEAQVFLNTSLHSPIPCALIEAAAAGAAIVTTSTTMIPDVFTHRKDAMLFSPDRPDLGRKHLEFLLSNPSECIRMGDEARKTVEKFFNTERFINEWNSVFERVSRMSFVGFN